MKRLIVMMLVGVAAGAGPHLTHPAQSPKDLAVNGPRKPMLVLPAPAVISPAVASMLVPAANAVVNTNRPPYTNHPQLQRQWAGFEWQATNGRGFNTYLIIWSGSITGPWTNVEQQVTPDGQWHTNGLPYDAAAKQKYWRLFRY